MSVVVSDTSPIRAFAFIERLDILESLFNEVLIPPAVANELSHPTRWGPPVVVDAIPYIVIRAPQRIELVANWRRELDLGERKRWRLRRKCRARRS